MNETIIVGSTAIPIIVGVVQVAKTAGLPARLAPVVALLLGIAAGTLSLPQTSWPRGLPAAAVLGLTWGLGASGLYGLGTTLHQATGSSASPYAPPAGRKQVGAPLGPLPPKR